MQAVVAAAIAGYGIAQLQALTTHCRSDAVLWKLRPIVGSPTLTTDPSMKARLDANIEWGWFDAASVGAMPDAVAKAQSQVMCTAELTLRSS
jgi:hypothetical protein